MRIDIAQSHAAATEAPYSHMSAWVPTLVEHRCSIGERGGFLRRLHEGTWPGHILEHLSLELLELAGVAAGFGRARETSKRGVYKVVIGSAPPAVSESALFEARELLMSGPMSLMLEPDLTRAARLAVAATGKPSRKSKEHSA